MTPPTVQFIPAGGLSLTIHDAFGGTGGLSGRTPDTLDNGNTWTTYNGETYTVSSGYVTASNDTSDFSKAADINLGTTTYKLHGLFRAGAVSTSRSGLVIAVTNATDGSETFAKVDYSSGFRFAEYSSGTATFTSISGTFTLTDPYQIILNVQGTTVDYEILNDTGLTTYASGTHTLSISATARAGINLVSGTARCYDFKAYT